jgi:ArsR family transcriptional regulator
MSTRSPKLLLFAQFATVAKSLAHAHRLELLEQLAQGERSVDTLAQRTGLSIANASQHLQHMRRAGTVTTRRDGKFVYYGLADDAVLDLLAALRRIAERNVAEVDRVVRSYFQNRDALEPVSREELLRRSRAGEVTILDVRPEDEFALGHLPGAINIPLGDLAVRLSDLDPAQEIVAYCRGAYCVLSYEAVAALRVRGFTARRLEDGFPEWRAAGLPVVGPGHRVPRGL